MTEEEARTKWCPMVRITWYPTPAPETSISGWNRDEINTNCIASDCMMWRKGEKKEVEIDRGYGQPPAYIDVVETGYCGLGGRP